MRAAPEETGPLQQRPARRELHRRRRAALADRLRVLGQQRGELRARQHLERVGALARAARGARRPPTGARPSPAKVARARLWGLMSKYGWTLWASIQDGVSDDRLRLLVVGDGEVRARGRRVRGARLRAPARPRRGRPDEPRRAALPALGRGCVVIGGGVGGASVAYHLAELGLRDVVVLEQHDLTDGTTWHSAGFVGQLRSSISQTRMIMYSTELYERLGAGDRARPGLARRRRAADRDHARARSRSCAARRAPPTTYGLELELLEPPSRRGSGCRSSHVDDVLAAAWLPGDGYVDPGAPRPRARRRGGGERARASSPASG